MSGYTRQSASEIIATNVVKAAPVNAEYNKLRDAFAFDSAGTTGHKHDGSSDEGSYVPLIADVDGLNKVSVDTSNNRVGVFVEVSSTAVEQVRFQDGAILPVTDDDIDLGAVGAEFKDLYLDGVAYIDDIRGPLTGDVTGNITSTGTSTFTTVDINGGAIDATIIGASTPAAITGTTITANTSFVGNLNGNVTGNLTGNVTGNITGDVTGDLTGNVTGNLTGNVTGDVTGNLTGNVTGDLTGDVTGNITSSGSSTFSGTITVPTPTSSTDAATKAYVDSQLDITVSDFAITESGTDLNFSYLGATIATMDSSGGIDVDSLSINGTAFDTTLATLSKSFIAGEESTLTLSSSVTSGVPVVSVTKEVSQVGVTNNNWDVNTNGDDYERYDTAYATTLTPSATSGSGTFTLGAGSFSPYDVGKVIEGNGGVAVLLNTSGDYITTTDFTDTSVISSGNWSMYGVVFDATNGVELSGLTSNVSYDSKFANLNGSPYGLFFKSDGTKFYTVESGGTARQYDMSTAWDTSTASSAGTVSVSSETTSPNQVFLKSDGTKMYVKGGSIIYQYTLSTPWTVSTATYDSVSFNANSQDSNPTGLFFKSDGTKMYISGATNYAVYQYSLSTAWDLSTASYDSVSFSISSEETFPSSLFISGAKMFISSFIDSTVHQYSLSTDWDLSTASYDNKNYVIVDPFEFPDVSGLFFKPNGLKLYTTTTGNVMTSQYSVSISFDLGVTARPTAQYFPSVTNSGGQI